MVHCMEGGPHHTHPQKNEQVETIQLKPHVVIVCYQQNIGAGHC